MADLVAREFAVDPDGEYVDALWTPPHETGWAFQACCVRNGRERFRELEYHAPAGCRRDESRVWGFRGPAARRLRKLDVGMRQGRRPETVDGFPTDHPFRELENILLSPHMAAASEEAAADARRRAVRAVMDVMDGCWPEHPVNPEVEPRFGIKRRA